MTRPGSHRGAQPDPTRRPNPHVADIAGRLLSGFGSPEGKMSAGRGVIWQDTNPAGAGKVYRKSTPNGNTGWVELGGGGGGGGTAHAVVVYGGDSVILPANTAEVLTTNSGVTASDAEGLWDPSTGIYTAPEVGTYMFHVKLEVLGASGTDVIEIDLSTSGGVQDIWADGPVFKKTFTWVEHFGIAGPCWIQATSWAGGASGEMMSFAAIMLLAG